MLGALSTRFLPNNVTLFLTTETPSPEIDGVAEFVKYQKSINGKATAYVCMNSACKSPTTDVREMLDFLQQ